MAVVILLLLGLLPAAYAQTTTTTPAFSLNEAPGLIPLNVAWLLLAGAFVLLMQAGFSLLQAGLVRSKNVTNLMYKNIVNIAISGLTWWAFGWGFAFGGDSIVDSKRNGFIGGCEYFLESCGVFPIGRYHIVFFQWTYCLVAVVVISGAIAERVNVFTYILCSLIVTGWIYPVVAHWCWSSSGWLSPFTDKDEYTRIGENGLLDFAGSGVVHLLAGTIGTVGVIAIRARYDRYPPRGVIETRDQQTQKIIEFAPHHKPLSAIAVLLLSFCWIFFNSGPVGLFNFDGNGAALAGKIVYNTLLSALGSMFVTYLVKYFIDGRRYFDVNTLLFATLAGFVSISSGCAFVDPWAAVVIGLIGGIVFLGADWLWEKFRIDDPLSVGPVHGFCGVWAVFATGLFATQTNIERVFLRPIEEYGVFYGGGAEQWGIQMLAIIVIVGWAGFWSGFIFFVMRLFGLLRVSEPNESMGLDMAEHQATAYDSAHLVEKVVREQIGFGNYDNMQYYGPSNMVGDGSSPPPLTDNPAMFQGGGGAQSGMSAGGLGPYSAGVGGGYPMMMSSAAALNPPPLSNMPVYPVLKY
uniref:Ammonium transporter 1.6 n=1 Tax=Bangia sp. ESS1 TaxID=2651159 RepID=A0A7S8BEF5_9RHOD|nr:ammonium transporter 1.6 [Bangia sp. ESS1]